MKQYTRKCMQNSEDLMKSTRTALETLENKNKIQGGGSGWLKAVLPFSKQNHPIEIQVSILGAGTVETSICGRKLVKGRGLAAAGIEEADRALPRRRRKPRRIARSMLHYRV